MALERRRPRRVLIIAISAAVAVLALAIAIVMIFGHHGAKAPAMGPVVKIAPAAQSSAAQGSATQGSAAQGSAAAPAAAAPSSAQVAAGGSASPAAATNPPAPPAPTTCTVHVTSEPSGAEVVAGKKVLGTTPGTFELPCGAETKLYVRKAHYGTAVRAVTPTTSATQLGTITLAHPMFAVKVTSIPAGATVTIGGKVLGITPTTIHLPAYATSTVIITKNGYAPNAQHLTPRANNTLHHVRLVPASRHR